MLPAETKMLEDQKDLFYFMATNFRSELQLISDLQIAEISETMYLDAAELMINTHH
jgi:hypothetical protein